MRPVLHNLLINNYTTNFLVHYFSEPLVACYHFGCFLYPENVQNMYKILDDLLTPPFYVKFLAFNIHKTNNSQVKYPLFLSKRLIINNGLQKPIIIYWGIKFGSRCAPLKSHNNHWLSIMLTGP